MSTQNANAATPSTVAQLKERRAAAMKCLSVEERRGFSRVSRLRTIFVFGHIWLGLFATYGALWLTRDWSWWAWAPLAVVCAVYVGTRLNALAVQVHEASHWLIWTDRAGNDRLCNLLAAYWVLNDVASYRRVHRWHHSALHSTADPDLPLYRIASHGGRFPLLGTLIADFFWLTAIQRIIAYLRPAQSVGTASGSGTGTGSATAVTELDDGEAVAEEPRARSGKGGARHVLGRLLAQGLVFSAFVAGFGLWSGAGYFLAFWVIPLFSIFPMLIRLRIVTEHYSPDLFGSRPTLVSRTSLTNALELYLVGAEMEYHHEHHLLPNLPHHQLKRLHRLLEERGYYVGTPEVLEHELSGGYFRFWYRLARGLVGPSVTG